ncbi:MAG: efflux RND transporter periplasmic adaptor subunit, partial [Acidobacteriaceae bacterium]
TPPEKKRRHRWIWVVVLLAFGLLFYWVIAQHRKSQAAAAPGGRRGMIAGPVPVVPTTATTGDLGIYLDAIGTVTPVYTDYITAQVTGPIVAVHYREGQIVKKGDPLIDIDPRPFQATLEQAQGTLERDQSLLAEAQMDLARYQVAWTKNAIPRQTLEDQEKLVLQDQGVVKNDQGVVDYDTVQLGYCHITSPIRGRVGLRLVDPGNLVTANATTQLVVVTEEQPITVIFTISEDNLAQVLAQLRKGAAMPVETWDRTNSTKIATGRLTTVNNLIDTTTGTVKLRAEFANGNDALFPNEFVNTRLLVNTLKSQVLLPSSAIQHNGDEAYVFLLESQPPKGKKGEKPPAMPGNAASSPGGLSHNNPASGQNAARGGNGGAPAGAKILYAVMQDVKTGPTDNNMTVVEGIKPGQMVANSSFDKLQNGSEVYLSKQQIPTTGTGIAGEDNAP